MIRIGGSLYVCADMILIIVTRSIRVNLCAWVEANQDGAHN